ncbi:MAG: hypothetical protein K0R82_2473 [Flavipsychrobacter sp.]|jgi:hypothetical protein|nr:hypothetical protein [Flavipsychrobacter sp.]
MNEVISPSHKTRKICAIAGYSRLYINTINLRLE